MNQTLKDCLTPLACLLLAAVMLFDHFVGCGADPTPAPKPDPPAPAPAPAPLDPVAAGRRYGGDLARTHAGAWLAGADALDAGKAMADVQAALQAAWLPARQAALATDLGPVMNAILPEGAEPDPVQRKALAACMRAIASGESQVK